jgi:hypothetical protein
MKTEMKERIKFDSKETYFDYDFQSTEDFQNDNR